MTEIIPEGEYALLEVVAVENIGAFLDWGQEKDLFLPFAEQEGRVEIGEKVIVYVYKDKADRFCASMRIQRNKAHFPMTLAPGDKVDLIIAAKTDLGYKAIINHKHLGMLYKNEVFTELYYGKEIQGYIKALRDDGKIDLSLQPNITGHKAAADIGPKILELLELKGGFLEINEKTPPEVIYEIFGVSKKKFKIAIGGLYKERLISIEEDGIRLTTS